MKLQPYLPEDIEDVAIEALEELVEEAQQVKEVEELKPLTASIAHHRAVSRMRERFAVKRGAGITESLEARPDAVEGNVEPAAGNSPLAELGQTELADLLGQLQTELKPEQRAILDDFFLCGLSYEQYGKPNLRINIPSKPDDLIALAQTIMAKHTAATSNNLSKDLYRQGEKAALRRGP